MSHARTYRVTVIRNGRIHELLAEATSPAAALKQALKENRSLREAIRDRRASYEVTTVGVPR
jgi:ERCC4-related helicase